MVDCPSQFCSHGVMSPLKDGQAYYCTHCGYVASLKRMADLRAVEVAVDPVLVASAVKETVPRRTPVTKEAADPPKDPPKETPVTKKVKKAKKKSIFRKGGRR